MSISSRRQFLGAGAGLAAASMHGLSQVPGERPKRAEGIEVLNPRGRVPLSFIIDDSTCLVNLNRFAIPQFAAAWNYTEYFQDWRAMPHEIPDDFVRRFGSWCGEHGVKGKYSIVPYPACVGRLDRELPGWSPPEIKASIDLVRDLMTPNWDIHPEMVTHTRVIDLKTGHPYPERSLYFMENWKWTDGKSVDEIAAYMAYALRILKNIDLPCEGITTPGGFGEGSLPEISKATYESVRDVYSSEIPHYFRHGFGKGEQSVAPRVEYAGGLATGSPQCVVSIVACTDDWTGGWDCGSKPEPDRFITPDLSSGRMVEVIDRGEPACLMAHWTGIYFNGQELGFKAFQEVVGRLHRKYDHLLWMKNSEIARYWAAKELTSISTEDSHVTLEAPYACPAFTLRIPAPGRRPPRLGAGPLEEVSDRLNLKAGTWFREDDNIVVCFDLPKGISRLSV